MIPPEKPLSPSPTRPWANWLLLAVFLGLLWLPTLDYFYKLDRSELTGENRMPASAPERPRANFGELRKFMVGAEEYFNDHFGFRNRLIRWFMHGKSHLFHDNSVYKVLTGPNGWLFLGELQMVKHYLGMAQFSPQELKDWQRLLEKRRDWLAQRDIQYLFVITPDKQTIYPEELPAWLYSATPTNRVTKLDQFLKFMQANSTVPILDLRQPLAAARQQAPTYLRNDTHWNLFGGFIGCQEVVKALSPQLPGLPPLNLADFQWTNAATTPGDLARLTGSDAAEINHYDFYPGSALPVLRTNVNPRFPTAWGLKTLFTIENPRPLSQTAVIFHDSFGFAMQPFLGYEFKRVVFEYENHDFNQSLILSNAPTVVINEILERFFNTHDPVEMFKQETLP